jgi:hypothetical protein
MKKGIRKVVIFGNNLEKIDRHKKTIKKFLKKKRLAREYYILSSPPTEGNIAGIRSLEYLISVMVTSDVDGSLLKEIKKLCTVKVFRPWEIDSFNKNLVKEAEEWKWKQSLNSSPLINT